MMTFYLNDCLIESVEGLQEEALVNAFCIFVESYARYIKDDDRERYRLILKDEPSKLMIGGKIITKLISLIPRDLGHESLRKKAYSMFNNYPANFFIEDKKEWNDEDWQDYEFLNQDANNLFIAHKEDWCIASVPIRDEVMTSPISIIGKKNGNSVNILNWYSKNSYQIKKNEYSELEDTEQTLKTLPYYFDGKLVSFSDEFVSQFIDPHCDVRDIVVARLFEAYKSSLLFPAREDNNIVKRCEGKGNESTYELRQKGSGMRAYFYCDEQRLILASIHTKAEYSSKADQTRDINHASMIISDILS